MSDVTHYENKLGYRVLANAHLDKYFKEMELRPIFAGDDISEAEIEALKAEKTVAELRAQAKELKVPGYSRLNETDLAEAILKAQ